MSEKNGVLAGVTIDSKQAEEFSEVAKTEQEIAQGGKNEIAEALAASMGVESRNVEQGAGIKNAPEHTATDGNILKGMSVSKDKEAEMENVADILAAVENKDSEADGIGKTLGVIMGVQSE